MLNLGFMKPHKVSALLDNFFFPSLLGGTKGKTLKNLKNLKKAQPNELIGLFVHFPFHLIHEPFIVTSLTWSKWNMDEMFGSKFHLSHVPQCLFVFEIPSCSKSISDLLIDLIKWRIFA